MKNLYDKTPRYKRIEVSPKKQPEMTTEYLM
jgi:hypothetical protein